MSEENFKILKKYACPYCKNEEILAQRNGLKGKKPWEGDKEDGWYVAHVCPVCAKSWTYCYKHEEIKVINTAQ